MFKWYRKLNHNIDKHYRRHTFKRILKKLVEHKSPHEVAVGASLGVFFSILPTFGIGMILALLIAWKRKLNIMATYIGTLIVNPFNGPFIYYLNYKLGAYILGENLHLIPMSIERLKELMTYENIGNIAGQLFLGGLIIATIISIFTMVLIYGVIYWYKDYKERKVMKLQEKKA